MTGDEQSSSTHGDALAEVLDLFVFAPIGAFLHGPETVGDLATKGRQDVANARFIGRAVIDRGIGQRHSQLGALVDEVARRGVDLLIATARAAGVPFADAQDTDADARDTAPGDPGDEAGSAATEAEPAADAGRESHLRVVADEALDVDELAIPGYDTLAASQVVPRLDDLSDDELAAVQDYERAHRGRMTILSRIAQLRAS